MTVLFKPENLKIGEIIEFLYIARRVFHAFIQIQQVGRNKLDITADSSTAEGLTRLAFIFVSFLHAIHFTQLAYLYLFFMELISVFSKNFFLFILNSYSFSSYCPLTCSVDFIQMTNLWYFMCFYMSAELEISFRDR